MVKSARRGGSTLGCLLWMIGFAVVAYHGIMIGHRYFLYFQLRDEFRSESRMAPGVSDPVIRRRITAKIDELGLNLDPRKVKIRRTSKPARIIISAEYADTLRLPLFRRVIVFRPYAERPL